MDLQGSDVSRVSLGAEISRICSTLCPKIGKFRAFAPHIRRDPQPRAHVVHLTVRLTQVTYRRCSGGCTARRWPRSSKLARQGRASIGGTCGNGRLLSDRRAAGASRRRRAVELEFFCLFRELTLASAHALASSLDGHAKRVRLTRGVNFSGFFTGSCPWRMRAWRRPTTCTQPFGVSLEGV